MPLVFVEPFQAGRWPKFELGRWSLLGWKGVVADEPGTAASLDVVGFLVLAAWFVGAGREECLRFEGGALLCVLEDRVFDCLATGVYGSRPRPDMITDDGGEL